MPHVARCMCKNCLRNRLRLWMSFGQSLSNQHGITYLMTMFAIVLIGIALMGISQHWSVIVKRDREAELLFRGLRIKEAIERFAADHAILKATRPNQYPLTLKELTQKPRRYLPVAYTDPMTNEDFELIKVGNEVHGVRSLSEDTPLDQVNFKGAQTYHAITFTATTRSKSHCSPNPANPILSPDCIKPSSHPPGQSNEPSPDT